MGDGTNIGWTDATWNPTRGCEEVNDECANCYAKGVAARFSGPGLPYEGLARHSAKRGLPQWTGDLRFVPDALDRPLRWQRARCIFVNSMSDLFHRHVDSEHIAAVFGVMAAAQQHTFQILTKRPERAVQWFEWMGSLRVPPMFATIYHAQRHSQHRALRRADWSTPWPLPNVHIGVSAGRQKSADAFLPLLARIPAALRFVSCEPLLEQVDLRAHLRDGGPSWVIAGGESQRRARPCAQEWIEGIVEQCRRAKVPCFVKQLGSVSVSESRTAPEEMRAAIGLSHEPEEMRAANGEYFAWRAALKHKAGADPSEWPAQLRVQEFPQ